MINFSKPTLDEEETAAVTRVLQSGWLAAGPETRAFEQEFAAYVGVKYAIFTNSCTSALKIAYKYFGDDLGIAKFTIPRNTFCATYSAASELGSEYEFRKENKEYSRDIRVNMHYGSVKDTTPCILEDSAHRIEPLDPLIGKIRCYSFYATKNMTTGAGGMFTTNDEDIYNRARLYWRDGVSTSTEDRNNGIQGYKVIALSGGYDGTDISAAMGRVQLRKLPQFIKRRNEIRDLYNVGLSQEWQGNHLYPFFVQDEKMVYDCISFLKSVGIHASHHYPGTGWNGVSLPIYPLLTNEEVTYSIEQALVYRNANRL